MFEVVRAGSKDKGQAAAHRRQQVVEIMRDAPGELPHGLHLLRLVELLACNLQSVLLGDVPGDLGVSDEVPVLVVHQVDHDVGHEAAAILAHPPAFVLEASVRPCGGQRPFRLAGRLVLGGEEARVVLSEDLVARIALGTFGTKVPAGDLPNRIEREDRVVHNAVDQQTEALLALP